MKIITWKTKLIIAAIIIALVLAGCGIVSAMDFGSWAIGVGCGWYAKYLYNTYFVKQ